MNKTYLGYLFMLLSAGAFASMSLFTKMAYDLGISVPALMLIQSVLAQLMLGYMWRREPGPADPAPRPSWWGLLLFASCGAGAVVAFNYALDYLSMSLGTILLFTYPAFVTLFAWGLLRQRPAGLHLVALVLTLAGAVLTTDVQGALSGRISLLGVGLALLAATAHGLYMVLGERVAASLSAVAATTLTRGMVLVAALALSPGVWAELPTISPAGWLVALLSTVVGGVAPFLFLNKGIAMIGANRAAIVSVAELPFAMALGLLFQGDRILLQQWLGAALIGAALIVSQQAGAAGQAQQVSGPDAARGA